jgi:hypothetical protein
MIGSFKSSPTFNPGRNDVGVPRERMTALVYRVDAGDL